MRREMDADLRDMLSILDPERVDPGYWHRLHRWVVNSAGAELARRRRAAAETVADVMLSWWHALVPSAALAAAVATVFVLRSPPEPEPVAYMNVDELLMEGNQAPVMPAFETADRDGEIILVNEVF